VPIVLNSPSTSDLFENNFLFCASGRGTPGSLQEDYALQLFGTLCASTTNHYSKAIHANAIDGLAYAFQSDGHCDVSSYVSLINPSVLTITLID
jgi:hypothetical protein